MTGSPPHGNLLPHLFLGKTFLGFVLVRLIEVHKSAAVPGGKRGTQDLGAQRRPRSSRDEEGAHQRGGATQLFQAKAFRPNVP